MEKISAACAMCWSIELEKGLRSQKSDHPNESINSIGPRLQQWSREPQLTMAVYNLYGLVPGEDRLYADAILLRLADAFVSGNKEIKISVIRVFLSTLKSSKIKDRQSLGIFSSMNTENRLEFLRRIKAVLNSESVESRALGLLLFGCCAAIAKEVAEIRLAVLTTLFSCHVLEVKASLFAAGWFSDISDDFGSVFLENLLNLINSPKTLPGLRMAAVRTFSKLGCSNFLAIKAYKAGAELVGKTLEEDILAAMLISLTKLSLKAFVLISEQVSLLSSLLSEKTSSCLRATVLKCMRNIGEEAACFLHVGPFPFQKLFGLLDDPKIPSYLHCEVLQIFLKVVTYGLPDMLFIDSDDFMKLLKYVDDLTSSPLFSVKHLAFKILVSISNKFKGRDELMLKVNCVTFRSGVVSAISNQITLLMSSVTSGSSSSEVEQELGSMLKLLLLLVKNHSDLGSMIVDKLNFVIKNMVNSQNMPSVAMQDSEVHKIVDVGATKNSPVRLLMVCIFRFLVVLQETLVKCDATSIEVVCKLKQLVCFVCDSSLFDCSIHTFFALLPSIVNRRHLSTEKKSSISAQGLNGVPSKLLQNEALISGCAKNMLTGGDNWFAYKAARYAACEGEWYVASFIFQHLEARVQSTISCQWLKFLAQFAESEKKVKVLLQQVPKWLPLDHVLEPSTVGSSSSRDIISSEYIENIVHAFAGISLSDKILEANSIGTKTFCFQRWFLALRLKVSMVLVDILKLLNCCVISKAGLESNRLALGIDFAAAKPSFPEMKEIMFSLVGISTRLASVADEFDLITSSFVDLDSESLTVISALALSCSVLACCAELTHVIANSLVFGNLTIESGYRQCIIGENLAVRLRHIDYETCMILMSIIKEYGVHDRSLHMLPGFQMSKEGSVSEDILTLCRSSIRWLTRLKKDCLGVKNDDAARKVYKSSMQLLLNMVESWMNIPFRLPKYFFRVRPTVGCQLIVQSAGCRKQNEISVSQGSELALNLCVQFKNITSAVCSRFSKIHCILSCKTSYLGTRGNQHPCGDGWADYQPSETGITIEMNKKLQCHVTKQIREFMNCGDSDGDEGVTAETYACFKTSGGAQGFSTCLLDVSAFPVGCYKIHWFTGGVDHQGAYWSFLPLSSCPQFSVTQSSSERL